MREAPHSILLLLKASPEVIRQRMKDNPHEYQVVQDGDVETVLERFEERFSASAVRRKFTLDTTSATVEETLAEFDAQIREHLTRLRPPANPREAGDGRMTALNAHDGPSHVDTSVDGGRLAGIVAVSAADDARGLRRRAVRRRGDGGRRAGRRPDAFDRGRVHVSREPVARRRLPRRRPAGERRPRPGRSRRWPTPTRRRPSSAASSTSAASTRTSEPERTARWASRTYTSTRSTRGPGRRSGGSPRKAPYSRRRPWRTTWSTSGAPTRASMPWTPPRAPQIWRFDAEGPIASSPVVADDAVYFTDRDGYLYARGHRDRPGAVAVQGL